MSEGPSPRETGSPTRPPLVPGYVTVRQSPDQAREGRGANKGWRKRKRHKRERAEHYVEELWVSRALLESAAFAYKRTLDDQRRLVPRLVIVDPCAGLGNVIRSARSLGFSAIGSDKRRRAAPHYVRGGVDFLSARYALPVPADRCALVFNPPFLDMRAFIEKAVKLRVDTVAALVPVHRLAAMSWLMDLPLTETLFLNPRPSMWPGRVYKRKLAKGEALGNGYQDFAWLVLHPGTSHCGFAGWLKRDVLRQAQDEGRR
jgi:hypothetical protein